VVLILVLVPFVLLSCTHSPECDCKLVDCRSVEDFDGKYMYTYKCMSIYFEVYLMVLSIVLFRLGDGFGSSLVITILWKVAI